MKIKSLFFLSLSTCIVLFVSLMCREEMDRGRRKADSASLIKYTRSCTYTSVSMNLFMALF